MATTAAQLRSSNNWKKRNPARTTASTNRRVTLSYLKNKATLEDLKEIEKISKDRKNYLEYAHKAISELDPIFKDLKQENYFSTYYLNLKSSLMLEKNFQEKWDDFKKIKGDPILVIIDNNIINLTETQELIKLEDDFLFPHQIQMKIEKALIR